MTTRVVGPLLVLLAITGCATHLTPAPDAVLVPGRPGGAVADIAGVRVVARPNAWRGLPTDLAREVTPILVTIDNGSTVPLRVRYEQFALEAQDGRRFAGLGPFDITGTTTELVPAAFIRPHFGLTWGTWHRYGLAHQPFLYDPFYYDPYVRRPVALPTGEMVQKALPEAVIEPGGRSTGFVYFEPVEDVTRVVFRAELVHARTGERFAIASIPFVVE